ncbi:hypothetical protein [Terriglobus tenax]|uniref:hypothetical protein n=1 Tax=Terriglobus tenax TaxID=1111115 RepID=UPI0021E01B1B|nr:hypothetical protein [Terriglobus tenax]
MSIPSIPNMTASDGAQGDDAAGRSMEIEREQLLTEASLLKEEVRTLSAVIAELLCKNERLRVRVEQYELHRRFAGYSKRDGIADRGLIEILNFPRMG